MSFLAYITGFFMNFELLPIMQIRKRGDEILKKNSRKLLSQYQPNFAEMKPVQDKYTYTYLKDN
jgi:hypothetical protein